ncbi:MAG: S9 family peptidase [Deltaproteobacteria bacterium]|nr:MAG: S9 family peptidase [Deltaproteobacteria bacterium]
MLLFIALALAAEVYQDPPPAIVEALDAPRPPAISFSRDNATMLELARPELPSIAELSEPRLRVAGLQVNPRTFGRAGALGYTAMTFRPLGRHDRVARTQVPLPPGARVTNVSWSYDDAHVAFTNIAEEGLELWITSRDAPEPRRLIGPRLNGVYGSPCSWLTDGSGLVCKVRPEGHGAPPERDPVPVGPKIEESLGRVAPARTYQNLLTDAHDERVFEHLLTSEIVKVDLQGRVTPLLDADLYDDVSPSPDASWLLVTRLRGPWSRSVPASRFARTIEAMPIQGGEPVLVSDLPLADDVPVPFGSVRTGRRTVYWRADQGAELYFVEALDGGDAGAEAELRDALYTLPAPFDGEPTRLWQSELRYAGVRWGTDGLALVSESWWRTRRVRTWQLDTSKPEAEPILHWDRSSQDRYGDPGRPAVRRGPHGWSVLRVEEGSLLLTGPGWSPEGMYPFYDRYTLATQQTDRVWQARDPWVEQVVRILDDPARFVTSRQSATQPPNYQLRSLNRRQPLQALTAFSDWAPAFSDVKKEVVRYTREDGLPLSATLYLPPGYRPKRDGPLPTIFWAYPSEFKSRDDAGQVTRTDRGFSRPGGSSHLFFLLQGYAVVDDPSIPIVGEGDDEPNDTFIEQLVAGAEAAVQTFVDRGVTDPDRTVVGGHSYGAFMTAHLLAHSSLFRAGIARSGAYNRTLTPFGFQGEERTFWQAPQTYLELSPFTHAHKIDEPILLLHGADDSNSGTYPIQSERLYEAIKGHGGTVRWVVLPSEDHGYRARESVGHALWEMLRWAEQHAAPLEP